MGGRRVDRLGSSHPPLLHFPTSLHFFGTIGSGCRPVEGPGQRGDSLVCSVRLQITGFLIASLHQAVSSHAKNEAERLLVFSQ